MRELKDYSILDIEAIDDERLEKSESGRIHETRVYIKSEADEVIADLEDKLKVQTSIAEEAWKLEDVYRTSYAEAVKELYDKNKEIAERKEKYNELAKLHDKAIQACCDADKVIRHQKYKRCLAMARVCRLRARWFGDNAFYKKEQWALQWHKRWLELAEKFKEAK